MAVLLLALAFVFGSATAPAYAQVMVTRDLRVTDATGKVTIEPAENPKAPARIDEDTPLHEQDVVVTGPSSQAELTLDGETVVRLQSASRCRILKILPNNAEFEL